MLVSSLSGEFMCILYSIADTTRKKVKIMYAKPENTGIAVAIAKELDVPDPEKSIAIEIIYGDERTDRDDSESRK